VAGADGCEVDVRRTADGILVCNHDPHVGGRAIIQTPAAELVAAGVPLLCDVIAAAGTRRLVIEVKNSLDEPDFTVEAVAAKLLVDLLAELAPIGDVLISSFDTASLDVALSAGWPVGLLTRPGVSVADGLAYATAAGYQELHAHVSAIDAPSPNPGSAVRDAGLRLVAWTVTSAEQVTSLLSRGVDAVIVDDPTLAAATLGQPSWTMRA
jgi:glycerophosphoryl diester phosphodiesterase